MMQLCEKCNNHYDDSFQEGPESCSGPGRTSLADSKNRIGHGRFRVQPIVEHIQNTQKARAERAVKAVQRRRR